MLAVVAQGSGCELTSSMPKLVVSRFAPGSDDSLRVPCALVRSRY